MKSGFIPALSRNGKNESLVRSLPIKKSRGGILKCFIAFILLFSLDEAQSLSSDAIIITAEKTQGNSEQTTSFTDAYDLSSDSIISLSKILQTQSQFSLAQTGISGNSSLYIRGGNSEYNLILVDGFIINDMTSPGGGFNISHLESGQYKSAEILKGPHSILYGADALAGVLKLSLNDQGGRVNLGYGSSNNKFVSIYKAGSSLKSTYSLSHSHRKADGISSYNEALVDSDAEEDGHKAVSSLVKISHEINRDHTIEFILLDSQSQVDIDLPSGDFEGLINQYEQSVYGLKYKYYRGNNFYSVRLSQNEITRDQSTYEGSTSRVSLQYKHTFKLVSLLFGVDHKKEKASIVNSFKNESTETNSPWINTNLKINNIMFQAGMRVHKSNLSKTRNLYKIGLGFKWNEYFQLKSNIASSYKDPSLDQFFNPLYGNAQLRPIDGRGGDLGFIVGWNKNIIEASYFNNIFKNKIFFNSDRYVNESSIKTEGIEFSFGRDLNNRLSIGGGFIFLSAKNKRDGLQLANRPEQKGNLKIDYSWGKKGDFYANFSYYGSRLDNDNSRLSSHTLLDLGYGLKIKNTTVGFVVNNVLDKKYEVVRNYGTLGRNYYAQISYAL